MFRKPIRKNFSKVIKVQALSAQNIAQTETLLDTDPVKKPQILLQRAAKQNK